MARRHAHSTRWTDCVMAVRRESDDSGANSHSIVCKQSLISAGLLDGYQTFLKPAVMLLLPVAVPASSTEVVTLSGPATICSMLNLLCHWLSADDELAPAEKVVP